MLADDDPEIARLYEITDVFKEKRALVKITHRLDEELGAGDRLGKEILYATEVSVLRRKNCKAEKSFWLPGRNIPAPPSR